MSVAKQLTAAMAVFTFLPSANAAPLKLLCLASQSQNADIRLLEVDQIEFDLDAQRIDLRSSKSGDDWTYKNGPYNSKLDWIDNLSIFRFQDGSILSAGIRARALFGFRYSPTTRQVTLTHENFATPGVIKFDCR